MARLSDLKRVIARRRLASLAIRGGGAVANNDGLYGSYVSSLVALLNYFRIADNPPRMYRREHFYE
jgi:hypothetical protein